jgi:hypothetical protein
VPQDLNTARNLYTAAASHGMTQAADRLKLIGPPAAVPGTFAPVPTGAVPRP